MKRLIVLGASLVVTAAVSAQSLVVSVKNREQQKEDAVAYYALPKNYVEVSVIAKKTVRKVGPFAGATRRLFGKDPKVSGDSELWSIENVTMVRKSEPDANQQYKVYAPFTSNACLVSLSSSGVISGVNSASAVALPDGKCMKRGCCSAVAEVEPAFVSNYRYKEVDEPEQEANDSVVVVKKKPELTDAEFVYEEINRLRKMKMDILLQDAEVLQDRGVSAYMEEIEKTEAELYALFDGKEASFMVRKTFVFYPDKEGNIEVFRFSEREGFSDSGEPVLATVNRRYSGIKQDAAENSKSGFVYRQPAVVSVEIKQGKKSFCSESMEVAQLGSLMKLPAGLFDKSDFKAEFDVETGALIKLSK
ncbi:MAG: DUF4831 family protein [Paludibacteraceae bacterium]|jgi:hypothetical protein|nr:DUF4831 family protein [Paludibacteraceae bacterium]